MQGSTQADTVQMDWFELDNVRAAIDNDHGAVDDLAEYMDKTVDGGEVELTWFEMDQLHVACEEGSKGREMLAERMNSLVN